jgi:hypothetical protein
MKFEPRRPQSLRSWVRATFGDRALRAPEPSRRFAFKSFEEFWPYYVSQHRDPVCRALHVTGTSLAIAMIAASPVQPLLLPAAPVVGYGFSWIGHFVFEKNKPAAFKAPWWSLLGDLRMLRLTLTGKMGPALEQAEALFPA